ncbi:MAG: hypothetical protein ACHRXM_16535 [Isosphaerales bacterium]
MDRATYECWAPPGGIWSPWVKPVLFAHLTESKTFPRVEIPAVSLSWDPTELAQSALVVDLPGLESLGLGLDLLRLGFRPVLLFNSCPAPDFLGSVVTDEVVPASPLLPSLVQGAERVHAAGLALQAAPAFLLDANRLGMGKPISRGCFDNRSVHFPSDFPSADFLARHGIARVDVVHRGKLHNDLIDVLEIWQRDGISASHIDLDVSETSSRLTLPPYWRSALGRAARRLWALFALRWNLRGGYGGFVPEIGSAGG